MLAESAQALALGELLAVVDWTGIILDDPISVSESSIPSSSGSALGQAMTEVMATHRPKYDLQEG